jgi:hypothetical protein
MFLAPATVAGPGYSLEPFEWVCRCLFSAPAKLCYINGEGRLSVPGDMDHWEAERWFERLPMYLLEEPKRLKVIKALERALTLAESGAFSNMPVSAKRS